MIPYDDLVIALQTWRAKQGLPVAQMSGSLTPPPMQAQAPAAAPRAQPPAAPGSGRTTAIGPAPLDPPLTHDESLDVDGALIEEEATYEAEGDDFAMAFGNATQGESTPGAEHTLDEGGTEAGAPTGRRNPGTTNDW